MEKQIEAILTDERLTDKQRETLNRFARALIGEGRAAHTQVSYLRTMRRFAGFLDGRRFEDVKRDDFERFMLDMHDKKKKAGTIRHDYVTVQRFYSWLGERYVRMLGKLKYKPPAGERHVIKAEDLPTQEEILRIIRFAPSIRDKTLIAMLWDLGTRPHELLNLKVKDVHFDEYGAVITVGEHGKTGARTLRLIFSLPYLREWVETHPFREDKNAPLFPNFANYYYGGQLSVGSLRRNIVNAAKLAGVEKHLYSYLFRHASITREATNGLGDQELKTFFGWTPDSQMLKTYSHLTSEDVNRKRLEQAGIIKPKERKHELVVQTCPRCGAENPVTHEFCNKCAAPLDETRYREMVSHEAEVRELREQIQELQKAKAADLQPIQEEIMAALPEIVELLAQRRVAKS